MTTRPIVETFMNSISIYLDNSFVGKRDNLGEMHPPFLLIPVIK